MNLGCVLRRIAAGCTYSLLLLALPNVARADVETCGAHLLPLTEVLQAANPSVMTYAYVLRADSPRSASGQIVADTDHGWFSWTFPMTPLAETQGMMTLPQAPITKAERKGDH
jgi:hypothetical protein